MSNWESYAVCTGAAGLVLLGACIVIHRIRYGRWSP